MDERIRAAIASETRREPFAVALGMELKELGDGFARVERLYDPARMNNMLGRAHGGAIFALIDQAFEMACNSGGDITVGMNVSVTYVASPEPGARLTAEAHRVSKTKRTSSFDIRVTAGGVLIAWCQALAFRTGKPLPFL